MKLLYDLFPVLLFFIAYKFFGIYIATGVAIAASLLQIAYSALRKKLEIMQIITGVIIVIFGTLTIALHNPIFIKWKPSIINWMFAIVFYVSKFFGDKTLLERIVGDKVNMPAIAWKKLNLMWIAFFFLTAVANIIVVYTFSTDIWVNFKVFGLMGLTFIFVFWQAFFISKNGTFIEEK